MKEIKELTQEELIGKEAGLREELFNLKFQFASGHFDNVARITHIKRDIARILTALNSNEKKGNN